jgi:hypothetical protein
MKHDRLLTVLLVAIALLAGGAFLLCPGRFFRQEHPNEGAVRPGEILLADRSQDLERLSEQLRSRSREGRSRAIIDAAEQFLQEPGAKSGLLWDSAVEDPNWQKGIPEAPCDRKRL